MHAAGEITKYLHDDQTRREEFLQGPLTNADARSAAVANLFFCFRLIFGQRTKCVGCGRNPEI